MKALSNVAAPAVLLAALAALPAVLIAFRQMADSLAATIPSHASALEQAEFWFRAFGG
jgi:hypothetical protein